MKYLNRPFFSCSPTRRRAARGFTLIELMVTLVVLVVVGLIAIPNIQQFVVRNQIAALANDFSASILQARTTAITRNSCVTLCQANNIQNAVTGGIPQCVPTATVANWMNGWMIFNNPTCDPTLAQPASADNLIKVVQPLSDRYQLVKSSDAAPTTVLLPRLVFDGRGLVNAQADLTLGPVNSSDSTGVKNQRRICLTGSGRVTIVQYSTTAGQGCP